MKGSPVSSSEKTLARQRALIRSLIEMHAAETPPGGSGADPHAGEATDHPDRESNIIQFPIPGRS